MLQSEVHRFYMEKGDEEIISCCHIPVKETPLHLLNEVFMFDLALDIVKSEDAISKYLWPEADYAELNVIYKISKNVSKFQNKIYEGGRDSAA